MTTLSGNAGFALAGTKPSGSTLSVLLTSRSRSAAVTVSVDAALLLARLLSATGVLTVVVLVISRGLGGATMKSGRTTTVTVAVAAESTVPRLQVRVLVPASYAAQVPALGVAEIKVMVPAGMLNTSLRTTLVADDGPPLFTVSTKVALVPAGALVGLTELTTLRSATGSTRTSAEALLLAGLTSPWSLDTTVARLVQIFPTCASLAVMGRVIVIVKTALSPGTMMPPVWLQVTVAWPAQANVALPVPPVCEDITVVEPGR